MLLNENLQEGLAKAFGIPVIGCGRWKVENKSQNMHGEFDINPLWVAQLDEQYRGEVVIAMAHLMPIEGSRKTKLGVLLVADRGQNKRLLGSNPFRSVNLGDKPDPVSEALKNINIFYSETSLRLDGLEYPKFLLTTYTDNSSGYFRYRSNGVMQDESLKTLWQGLLSTVKMLAQAYDDAEINEFFKRDSRKFY